MFERKRVVGICRGKSMKIEMDLVNLATKRIGENNYGIKNEANVNFGANNASMPEVQKLSGVRITKISSRDINNTRPANFSRALTFTGNSAKNYNQIASIAPEYQGFFDASYKVGGLGNVAGEAGVAMKNKGGADIRTFIPYYAQDNPDGKLKIKRMTPGLAWEYEVENADGTKKNVSTPAYVFEAVDYDYELKEGEEFVVHEAQKEGAEWKAGYKVIEDTGIKGSVENIKPDFSGVDKTPYRMFKAKPNDENDKRDIYLLHLQDTARFPKAYAIGMEKMFEDAGRVAKGYGASTGSGAGNYDNGKAIFSDLAYANFDRAVIDAIPKMNNRDFGNYNPASYWLHDRHAFPSAIKISEESDNGNSYWRGIRAHSTFHNPGRGYQGFYSNPLDFMRIVGTKKDLEALKEHPQWEFISEMNKKIEAAKKDKKFDIVEDEVLSDKELKRLREAFLPIIGEYADEMGTYNLCKIPIAGINSNPDIFSAGTVSTYYGKEMKDPKTKEIALGLTEFFRNTKTIDIVNGSTPASLNLHNLGHFAPNNISINGFTEEIKKGFKPFPQLQYDENEKVSNIKDIYDIKQSNKKWFLNTVAEATKKGPDALAKLFFTDEQIREGANVLGGLSEFKKGDQLFVSWGRADKQKGFPTTLESFYQYFSSPGIPDELKAKTKVVIGGGPWPENPEDELNKEWLIMQETIKKIQELDDGKYKDNLVYTNGRSSNRFGMLSDWSIITSEYEPCGITPLESFATATPVLSNRTGGSPDLITEYDSEHVEVATGFLTKTAYKVNPEVVGGKKGTKGDKLETIRREALGAQNAENIRKAMELSIGNPDNYIKVAQNAISLKIDWHENSAFNGGKTAMQRYFEDAWHLTFDDITKTFSSSGERNEDRLKPLVGKFFDPVLPNEPSKSDGSSASKTTSDSSKLGSIVLATGGSVAALNLIKGGMKNQGADKKVQELTQKLAASENTVAELKKQLDGTGGATKNSLHKGVAGFFKKHKVTTGIAVAALATGAAVFAYSKYKKAKEQKEVKNEALHTPQAVKNTKTTEEISTK